MRKSNIDIFHIYTYIANMYVLIYTYIHTWVV
jgi:hypothetical protein